MRERRAKEIILERRYTDTVSTKVKKAAAEAVNKASGLKIEVTSEVMLKNIKKKLKAGPTQEAIDKIIKEGKESGVGGGSTTGGSSDGGTP